MGWGARRATRGATTPGAPGRPALEVWLAEDAVPEPAGDDVVWMSLSEVLEAVGSTPFRDRRTLAILLILPLAQVLLFGFAVRTDIQEIRIALVDPTPDAATLSLAARLSARVVQLYSMCLFPHAV